MHSLLVHNDGVTEGQKVWSSLGDVLFAANAHYLPLLRQVATVSDFETLGKISRDACEKAFGKKSRLS